MAGHTGTYDEDQVNSGGLLGPELTTQVGVKGRRAGDDIASKFLNIAAGAEATPPEQILGGGIKAPKINTMSPLGLPGRASRGGYPAISESRYSGGESSVGPAYIGDQPAISERTIASIPSEKVTSEGLSGGRTQYNTPEGQAIAGPERFFRGGREVDAGTRGAESGDELARRRMESESRAQFGEPTDARSTLNIGGKSYELAGGRTLAQKEEQEGKPEDFDFGKYKKALEAIGGKPSLKMQTDLLSHMYGEHTRREDVKAKMKELGMVHGEGSPEMIRARSEASYQDIIGKATAAKAPAEVQAHLAAAAKTLMETHEIPYRIAQLKAETDLKISQTDLPAIKRLGVELANYVKMFEGSIGNPAKQAEYESLIMKLHRDIEKHSMVSDYNRAHGTNIDPNQIQMDEKTGQWTGVK